MVFNFYGYRLVISYLQQQQEAVVETKIEEQSYNEAELISIKTTLNLPYYNSSPEFERAYGSISINGIDYEYVKRRVYNDTLELLCLPNYGKTKLQNVTAELTKNSAESGASQPLKKATTVKISLPDFFQRIADDRAPGSVILHKTYFISHTKISPADYSLQQERPPQFNA